jgi:hypothetical protein
MKEKIDLIALTSQRGDMCYREIKGEKIYDFRRVIITVTHPDGSKKKYEINRATCGYQTFKHHIETYTVPKDAYWFDTQRGKRWKWYTDENFNDKLKKLSREIEKTDYKIELW